MKQPCLAQSGNLPMLFHALPGFTSSDIPEAPGKPFIASSLPCQQAMFPQRQLMTQANTPALSLTSSLLPFSRIPAQLLQLWTYSKALRLILPADLPPSPIPALIPSRQYPLSHPS